MEAWRVVHALHQALEDELATAIKPTGLTLVEFAVLDILEEQIDGHLRMQDVASVAGLTTGASTRLVNRLEERGLLVRVLCHHDRRGIFTELTDAGRELLAGARALHDATLRTTLDRGVDLEALRDALATTSDQ